MQKLQTQGVHHITINRRESADGDRLLGGRARHAVRVRAAEPRQRLESHLYFDPGDGRLITVFTNEEREPIRTPRPRGRFRAPPGVLALPGDVRADRETSRRARHPALGREGPRLHGLDLLRGSARSPDRARVLPLRATGGPTHTDVLLEAHLLRVERGDPNIDRVHLADAIERLVTRYQASLSADRSPKNPYR